MAALLEHDPAAVETTGRIRIPCTVDAARDWLALVTGPAPEGGLSIACTIEGDDGALLGNIGLAGTLEEVEVGYWVGRPFWGQGVASQALALLLAEARARGVKRIKADTVAGNIGSEKVLLKAGFAFEADGFEDNPLRGRRPIRSWGLAL
jgi:RimJ/RimL family protein N-acetyltransferase